jgi:hypothetical protein
VHWLAEIDSASDQDIRDTVTAKPSDFSGSKYATKVSGVRITGFPEFIEAVVCLFKPLLDVDIC